MTKPVTWSLSAETALERIKGRLFATTTETAQILRYDARTLRRAIGAGEIPAVRAGTTFRIPTAWIREQAQVAAQGGGHAA